MQIVYIQIANFFGNDRLNSDLISANNRQFESWSNWTILTSVHQEKGNALDPLQQDLAYL